MESREKKSSEYIHAITLNLTGDELDSLRGQMKGIIKEQKREIKQMQEKKEKGLINPWDFDIEAEMKDLQRYINLEEKLALARKDIEKQVIDDLQEVAKQYGTDDRPKVEIIRVAKQKESLIPNKEE